MTETSPSSTVSRIGVYFREMYPLQVYLPGSFLSFFGLYFLMMALIAPGPLVIGWRTLAGAVTLACFSLLMRLFDEFKDYEVDKTMFPDRALPAGRVQLGDLHKLGWGLLALMVALNVAMGPALIGFAMMITYGGLTWRYFFVPHLHKDNLLLTVATHNPVMLFCCLYAWTVVLAQRGDAFQWPGAAGWAAIAMYWAPILAWEFSRKIKAPESENAYITYSRVLGPRVAALIPTLLITVSAGLAVSFIWHLGAPAPAAGVVALAWGYAIKGFVRWQLAMTPENATLKPYVEAFSLGLYIAVLIGMVWRFGVVWG